MKYVLAICRKCEHEWYPNPLMWRNNNNINKIDGGKKVLRCPNCNAKNYLSVEMTSRLRNVARNERLKRMREQDPRIKEFKRLRRLRKKNVR